MLLLLMHYVKVKVFVTTSWGLGLFFVRFYIGGSGSSRNKAG